jgi:D-alanyl-D-alanine carboxypeptidase (penicillin-binding protein 5/6)
MRIDVFQKVVATTVYETAAICNSPRDHQGKLNTYRWENSNKLLGKYPGIKGCKTGITTAAGPCLAGYYENGDTKLAIILCHSKSMDHRWEEIKVLVEWYFRTKKIREMKK